MGCAGSRNTWHHQLVRFSREKRRGNGILVNRIERGGIARDIGEMVVQDDLEQMADQIPEIKGGGKPRSQAKHCRAKTTG